MQYDTDFSIRYRVDAVVSIADIIESLQGIDVLLRETALHPSLSISEGACLVRSTPWSTPVCSRLSKRCAGPRTRLSSNHLTISSRAVRQVKKVVAKEVVLRRLEVFAS